MATPVESEQEVAPNSRGLQTFLRDNALDNLSGAFLDLLPAAVYFCDHDGALVRWNQRAIDLWGRTPQAGAAAERFCGSYKLYRPDGAFMAHGDCPLADALRTGQAQHDMEAIIERPDGSRRFVLANIDVVRDAAGVVIGAVNVLQDISDRKQAEESLRQSEQRFRSLLDKLPAGGYTCDAQGLITYFNRRAVELWGREPRLNDPVDRYCGSFKLFSADGAPIVHDQCWMALALRENKEFIGQEIAIERPDGSRRAALAHATPFHDESGNLIGTVNVLVDITDRKRSEGSLQEAERRFKAVFNQQFQFMTILAPDGTLLESNDTCFKASGFQRAQVIGRPFWETPWWDQLPETKARLKQYISLAAGGGGPVTGEVEYRLANGAIRRATAAVTGITDDAGRVTNIIVEGRDDTDRARHEAALRESELKLRLLADTIPQLAWMARPDGHVFWFNRRWYEYTGATPEQMEGWGWQSIPDSNVLPSVLEQWRASLATGDPFDMVFPLRRADGELRPFLTRVNPLRDEQGRILYWFGTNTDVTELREAREALVTSEERLRLALDAGRMGVWDWNIRTGDLNWSDSLEPLHGLAPGAFGGTIEAFQQLIHPDDRAMVNEAIGRAIQLGSNFDIHFRNIWPDGGVHWIAGKGKAFPGEDGSPSRMIGVGLDVTQQKRSEQTARFLADVSATLATLVDFDHTLQQVASLAVPYFADWATVDLAEPDGALRRVAVAHVDPAKVELAQDIHRRFPPDPAAPHGAWNILRTGQSEMVPEITDASLVQSIEDPELLGILRELGLKSYIGVPLKVRGKTLAVISFFSAESGHVYDSADLALAQDIANRAAIAIENSQLYRELREADRRKDEFLAMLAHELRNPLAPIRNALEILKMSRVDADTAQQVRDLMERQVQHLVRLVDDLLDVSRVMRSKIDLRKEPVEMASVVARAVETAQPLLDLQGHRLEISLSGESLLLDADPVRLAQVVGNLLTNAAKYTEPNGRIWLVAERRGDQAILRVRDNGIGIASHMLPHVFELFVQVDHASTRSQGGLGIGLTLVKNLVEMHGGEVRAHSDGLGKGSEFEVRLPLLVQDRAESAEKENPGRHPHIPPSGHRLLVVDDNQDAATTFALWLRTQGHDVQVAHSGPAALELAGAYRPDLVFLDIGMPGMDGCEVARRMRQMPGLERVVLAALTGWGQQADRQRTAEAGFDHHLVKPTEPKAVEELLASL